tara:strand:- start:3761 stop:5050 length:1290 start_codon:yes stop_codon:yes gene_type:complete
MATFPYLIYLVIKNKNLNLKHYFIIAFIGLNFALVFHVFIVPILLLVSLIFCSNYQQYNLKLFIKISVVLLFFAFLSNSNLIYAQLFSGPFHRTGYIFEAPDLIVNFTELVREFFSIPVIKGNPYFYQRFLFDLCAFFIIIISLFSKNKKVYFLLLIIFFIAFFNFLLNLESIAVLRNNVGGIFKTISWDFIKFSLPVLYGLLFVLNIKFVTEKIKHFFYPLIFLILIISQVNVSIVPLTKHFLSFNTLNLEQKNQLRESFHGHKYTQLISDIIEFNRNNKKEFKVDFKSQYTFRGYYDYENYRYIKSLVGDSRTVSIALDPMVAVMNNIKVIDGYHTLYPLSYKLKFRKVIEKQLDNSEETKKYFDLWGNRISTFVEDKESIKTNFIQAKLLGAEYVISKYSISNDNLLPICEKCNNSAELFLYKIII